MYYNGLNEKLYNYIFLESKTEYGIALKEYKDELQKWERNKIKLKPVKKFLDDNNTQDYPYVYTTAMSPSWFDAGKYDFYVNGKHVLEWDEKDLLPLHFQGYIYLNFKVDTPIASLLVVRTNLPVRLEKFNSPLTFQDNGTSLKLAYNDNFEYKPTLAKGRTLVIDKPYFCLNSGENLYDKYPNMINWLYDNKITNMILLNTDTGIVNDYSDVINEPMYLAVKTNPKLKMIIFYEGIDPATYTPTVNNDTFKYLKDKKNYMEDIFSEYLNIPQIKNIIMDHRKDLLLQKDDTDVFNEIEEYSQKNDMFITNYLLYKNYDLFMELYKRLHRTKIPFIFAEWTRKADNPYVDENNRDRDMPEIKERNELLKFTFINYYQNPFEIYFCNTMYQGTFIHDTMGISTTIYINKGNLLDYYNLKEEDLPKLFGQILIRGHAYKRVDYNNIHKLFNGTLAISSDWFSMYKKRVLDNGIYLKNTDYELNRIHPSNMVCVFPKRAQKHHKFAITGYTNPVEITTNTYKIKVKNTTPTEGKKINTAIHKNLFFTDYIDYRFNIYIGPYLLMENIDYRILAPNLVEFLRPITVFTEDKDSEYIDMIIEYEGIVEDILLQRYKFKSFRYRFFNNQFIIDTLYDIRTDTQITDKRADTLHLNPGSLYDVNGYKLNMMMTKYFASENVFTGDRLSDYGFGDLIKREFPQFIQKVGSKNFITTNIEIPSIHSIPRRSGYPSSVNLSHVINQHVVSAKEMINQNRHFGKETYWDTGIHYRYKSELYMLGDINLDPNIPINYVLDDNL